MNKDDKKKENKQLTVEDLADVVGGQLDSWFSFGFSTFSVSSEMEDGPGEYENLTTKSKDRTAKKTK